MKNRELETTLPALLASSAPDAELRTQLELLAQQERGFPGLTWLWGPSLYRRNRVLFRPFILSHFATWLVSDRGFFQNVEWKRATGEILEGWLAEADAADDAAIFRRLLEWKVSSATGWKGAAKRLALIAPHLLARLESARTAAARQLVLQKFDLWFTLDEQTALALYQRDPAAAAPYILRRLPASFWGQEKRVCGPCSNVPRPIDTTTIFFGNSIGAKCRRSSGRRMCSRSAAPRSSLRCCAKSWSGDIPKAGDTI